MASSGYKKTKADDTYGNQSIKEGDDYLMSNKVNKFILTDGTVQQDWTIDNRTLWKPWHSRKAEYALPWEAPTGAHDMYHAGEYMIWTDGTIKKCIQDTNFSPEEYAQAWENA